MSWAICSSCGAEQHWRGQRGCKLSDHRCAKCGGELRSRTAGRESPGKGQRFELCAYCGRKRQARRLVTLPAATWLIGREMPPGARICGWHELAEEGGKSYRIDPVTNLFVTAYSLAAGAAAAPRLPNV